MMALDTFLYNGEEELLQLRLRHLNNGVEAFIIVESEETFSGMDKPIYTAQHIEHLPEEIRRKVYLFICRKQDGLIENAWEREYYQRDKITEAVQNFLQGRDAYIMMSDVDEIPRINFVEQRREGVALMTAYLYRATWHNGERNWLGTIGVYSQEFLEKTGQEWRNHRHHMTKYNDSGWHFTYQCGPDEVERKVRSYAHQENNNEAGRTWHRGESESISGKLVDMPLVHGRFPSELVNNPERYPLLLTGKY